MKAFILVLYILTNAYPATHVKGAAAIEGVILRDRLKETECIDLLNRYGRVLPPIYMDGGIYAAVGLACREKESGR